ncbi:DUF4267 domain-containing protein [Kitasatospora viridis]|uniref:Uncharacterized protein DUF4267 n=1 Tax=Kitasatospora viridis TaxID=281105 RepID=A0A561UHQ1_9ACTN|nr:DUF4267 domain-containing protein [Kitasatospora viridis]TWF98883.1 uncharacterized protein DUF4267 [Kitasatospora viridis]
MTTKRVATACTLLGIAFILFIGVRFLVDPHGAVAGFGIPGPRGTGEGFYDVKGVRDITSGLVPLALLLSGQRRALGWAMLATAFTPLGDAVIVLSHHGPLATALGVHAATALFVLLTAALLLRETRPSAGAARATAPALA